jgi:hypothetical protein
MTTTSRWDTGTYELLISKDPEGGAGDLMVVVFARPMDLEDTASDEDAPILAHIDVLAGEYQYDRMLEDYHYGVSSYGEKGLLRPEDVEAVYGPRLGLRILLALFQAAERDFHGIDMDNAPWRTQSTDAFHIMKRSHALLMELKSRL